MSVFGLGKKKETKVKAKISRRELTGVVVSNKMNKTVVVEVNRKQRHQVYKKYLTNSKKFKAHDEENKCNIGDLIRVVESRPLSRDKRWVLTEIVRPAANN